MRNLTRHFPQFAVCAALICAALVCGLTTTASASVFTLSDENSVIGVDSMSQRGMFSWQVNGVEQLVKQWFWFRAGSQSAEQSIDSLNLVFEQAQDSNGSGGPERLVLLYSDPNQRFEIGVDLLLVGGTVGSPSATVVESLRIRNLLRSPLGFNFFQYVDFDLAGTAGGDTAELINANTIMQSENGFTVAETVATPRPSRYEIGLFPSILNKLNDNAVTNLNNNGGPVVGDASWAFQWNFTLPPDGTFLISKIKHLTVPEPGSVALGVCGLLGIGLMARRRRAA